MSKFVADLKNLLLSIKQAEHELSDIYSRVRRADLELNRLLSEYERTLINFGNYNQEDTK